MTATSALVKTHSHRVVYKDHPTLERWRVATCVREGCAYEKTIHRCELAWWTAPANCEGVE